MAERSSSPARLLAVVALAVVTGVPLLMGLLGSESATAVDAYQVRRETVAATLTYRGRLVSRDEVSVSSNLVGRVERVLVAEGDRVSRGQPLVILDTGRAEAQVENARSTLREASASLENARARFERARTLFESGLVSEVDFLDRKTEVLLAKARVEALKASLESQQEDLAFHTIHAPIDGIITSLQVKPGSTVVVGSMNNPATVMLTLADLADLEVELEMDEVDFGRTRLGMPASVELPAFADLHLEGRIHDYNVKAVTRNPGWDNEETFVNVYIALDEVPEILKPGLTAEATLVLEESPDTLCVPIQAVVERDPALETAAGRGSAGSGDGGLVREARGSEPPAAAPPPVTPAAPGPVRGVYVIDDASQRLRFVPVEVGVADSERIEVTAGALAEGQRVVAGPFRLLDELRSGMKVRVQ